MSDPTHDGPGEESPGAVGGVVVSEPWQEKMQKHLSDADAAAQNDDFDEAAMWAQAALEDWEETPDA